MIECHTPFSSKELVDKYGDSFVLVSGLGRMLDLAELYGYKKALDIEELFALYPATCPSLQDHFTPEYISTKLDAL